MPFEHVNRHRLNLYPLAERENRARIEADAVAPEADPGPLTEGQQRVVNETADRIRAACGTDRARMLVFGAHTIKNGLGPLLIRLIDEGWFTHLATNGAGIIHDWEFAYQGATSEHVEPNVAQGRFGAWRETGFYLNLAILVGAFEGLGYGESVGAFVDQEGLTIPSEDELLALMDFHNNPAPGTAAAAADLLSAVRAHQLEPGWLTVPHPYKKYGLQAAAYRLGLPFTGHPMFGHDIIYIHPINCGAAIGRTAERDFLAFAESVTRMEGGVYVSVGSAVMSPMVFEKTFSMAQNLALQEGPPISGHLMTVADLAESRWDWSRGEPPEDHPDYYLRYNKTFSRMGGTLRYVSIDNRSFLLALYRALSE